MSTEVVYNQPFINHFADFAGLRKAWDKSGKTLSNGAKFVEWVIGQAGFGDSTARAAFGAAAKEISYLRSVIKLLDFIDDFEVPGKDVTDDPMKLAFHVTRAVGFGVADLTNPVLFGDDVGLWDLGEAAGVISHIGNSFALMALVTVVTEKGINIASQNEKLAAARLSLEHQITNRNNLTLENCGNDDAQLAQAQLANDRAIIEITQNVLKAEKSITRSILDIISAILDISAIVFGFMVAGIATILSLGIATPLFSILGGGSGLLGVIKVWMDTTDDPEITISSASLMPQPPDVEG